MKKCKFCAEEINEEATKCKFCGEWISQNVKSNDNESKAEMPIKKRDFLERDTIKNSDTLDIIKVKQQWNNFVKIFWLLFVIKLISKGAETAQDESIALIFFTLQFPAIIGMVLLMGYYSYKFSGKKSHWLFGLLGLLWFAIIGIFIGFWQVQRLKNIKLKAKS